MNIFLAKYLKIVRWAIKTFTKIRYFGATAKNIFIMNQSKVQQSGAACKHITTLSRIKTNTNTMKQTAIAKSLKLLLLSLLWLLAIMTS